MIDGKMAERLCGDGPDLSTVLRQDEYLVKLRRNVIKFFKKNFEAAIVYIQKFEVIGQFVTENKEKDQESIENETGIVHSCLKNTNLLANISLKNMANFEYLSATLTNQNRMHEEIKSRLNSRNGCYHSVQNVSSAHMLLET